MTTSTLSAPQPSARSDAPIDWRRVERDILPQVFKPGRYLGIEQGAVNKPWERTSVRMVLAFPELYEIGISNYAHKLLYSLVNQHSPYLCDRSYAPAPDMKAQLAEHSIPLYGVESKRPLAAFDVVAFSLQYELNYTTALGLLESAQIPFYSQERPDPFPLIVAGGPGATHPSVMAPFVDAFMIGDGEELLIELLDAVRDAKKAGDDKAALLQRLAAIDGVYVPGVSAKAYKRIIDISQTEVDMVPLLPTIGAVHDRVVIEARRGCDRMCRFCQPCFINLPVREQSIEKIKTSALKEIEKTGYEECSLLSLSIADFSHLKPLITEVSDALREHNASMSLPSQRADRFNLEVAEAVQQVRKSTLTFAPEAGTPRLRDVINKNLTDEEILSAVTTSYRAGWSKVKLYFIIGLPTETQDDLDGIVSMVHRLKGACRQVRAEMGSGRKQGPLEINITLSNFVPKPHTPFQWFPPDTMAMLREKIGYLRDRFRGVPGVKLNFTDPEVSKLEAVVSKADEALAPVMVDAYRRGAYLDAWGDPEPIKAWFDALAAADIDPETYTRERLVDPADPLPWDAIDVGLTKHWLVQEYERARAMTATTPCFEACSTCGVCGTYSTWPKFIEAPKDTRAKLRVVGNRADGQDARPKRFQQDPVAQVRLTIRKQGPMRFVSHLDWLRMLQRVIVRAKVPIAYSQGFNPKPKMAFSPALPMFCEGRAEFLDLQLVEPIPPDEVMTRLNRHLNHDAQVTAAETVPLHGKSIDAHIQRLEYQGRRVSSDGRTCTPTNLAYTMAERVALLTSQSSWLLQLTWDPQSKKWTDPKPLETPGCEASNPESLESQSSSTFRTLNVAPFVAGLTAIDGHTVQFEILKGVDPESGQPMWIRPSWVLTLLDPEANWGLARTAIHLQPTA